MIQISDHCTEIYLQYRFVHFLLQGFRQRIETELTRPFNQNYFILQPEFSPANGFNQRSRIRIKAFSMLNGAAHEDISFPTPIMRSIPRLFTNCAT